jgi:GDP-4-dehydro-6-deoxy-D-mannose reductase
MIKIAIFGISGFSGRYFEQSVLEAGHADRYEFYGLDISFSSAAHSGVIKYRECDATDGNAVSLFLEEVRPDYIVNLIGTYQAETFGQYFLLNVDVSHSICDALIRAKILPKKILLIGSAAEYGTSVVNPVRETAAPRPVNLYGITKLFQTQLAEYYYRNYGLPIVVARTFNILGEGLSKNLSIGSFMSQIDSAPGGGSILVGNINTSRDFLDIKDVIGRYWELLLKGEAGEIYNICSGTPRTIRSVLEDLIRQSGKSLIIEIDPMRFKEKDIESIYGDPSKYEALVR